MEPRRRPVAGNRLCRSDVHGTAPAVSPPSATERWPDCRGNAQPDPAPRRTTRFTIDASWLSRAIYRPLRVAMRSVAIRSGMKHKSAHGANIGGRASAADHPGHRVLTIDNDRYSR